MTAAPHVAVVGGGFAGLAAAVRLARSGARVTLLERRPFLGGRTYSFTHPATGEVLDNGPHVLMGAYTEALDFLAEIGASDKVAVQPRLHVAMASGCQKRSHAASDCPTAARACATVSPARRRRLRAARRSAPAKRRMRSAAGSSE